MKGRAIKENGRVLLGGSGGRKAIRIAKLRCHSPPSKSLLPGPPLTFGLMRVMLILSHYHACCAVLNNMFFFEESAVPVPLPPALFLPSSFVS